MEYADLDSLIDDLERIVGRLSDPRPDWTGAWESIKRIGSSFKGTRYPAREDGQASWLRFQSLVSKVKRLSAEARSRDATRIATSERLRDRILSLAEAATPPNDIGRTVGSVFEVASAGFFIRGLLDSLPGPPLDEERCLLERCSTVLADGFKALSESKADMTRAHKDLAYAALVGAQDRLNAAWTKWKSTRLDEFERRQARREERHQRVQERIGRLESRVENLTVILQKAESHLETLAQKRQEARSESYRDRVDGWIREEESRIDDIKSKLREVEVLLDTERRRIP